MPDNVDYVMYWWEKAALLLRSAQIHRFGLITTNSITQTFNRKVVQTHLNSNKNLSLAFAVPDHPWVDSKDGAAVRIAMTVVQSGTLGGVLYQVETEDETVGDDKQIVFSVSEGTINPDLSIGADFGNLVQLSANGNLAFQGPIPVGEGFRISSSELTQLGSGINTLPSVVRRYVIGRDLMQRFEERFIIDFYGLTQEEATTQYPLLMQKVITDVKPYRDTNQDKGFREQWWIWGRPRPDMRKALRGLDKYIATCRTAKHRVFTSLAGDIVPDTKVIAVASSDDFHLGVLSSRAHIIFATKAGGWLGVGNDSSYNHADCFNKFPFPDCTEEQKARIRELGEALDAHRKRQQAQHPTLTITEMYNVLEKLRRGEQLNERERTTHEQGLVSVLRQLHEDLDAAVFDAYGWPTTLSDEDILERLVRLNAERAAEERAGTVRWLRPEFQKPAAGIAATFGEEFGTAAPAASVKTERQTWPKSIPEQARAVRQALAAQRGVVTSQQLAAAFRRANVARIEELLQTLVSLGQAREVSAGRYAP
jgi:hypothetical protein